MNGPVGSHAFVRNRHKWFANGPLAEQIHEPF